MNSGFFDQLKILYEDNKIRAADYIDSILSANILSANIAKPIEPWNYYKREILNIIWNALQSEQGLSTIYSGKECQERLRTALQTTNR